MAVPITNATTGFSSFRLLVSSIGVAVGVGAAVEDIAVSSKIVLCDDARMNTS